MTINKEIDTFLKSGIYCQDWVKKQTNNHLLSGLEGETLSKFVNASLAQIFPLEAVDKIKGGEAESPSDPRAWQSRQRKEAENARVAAVLTGKTLLKFPSAFSVAPCLFITLSSEANWIWIYLSFWSNT